MCEITGGNGTKLNNRNVNFCGGKHIFYGISVSFGNSILAKMLKIPETKCVMELLHGRNVPYMTLCDLFYEIPDGSNHKWKNDSSLQPGNMF